MATNKNSSEATTTAIDMSLRAHIFDVQTIGNYILNVDMPAERDHLGDTLADAQHVLRTKMNTIRDLITPLLKDDTETLDLDTETLMALHEMIEDLDISFAWTTSQAIDPPTYIMTLVEHIITDTNSERPTNINLITFQLDLMGLHATIHDIIDIHLDPDILAGNDLIKAIDKAARHLKQDVYVQKMIQESVDRSPTFFQDNAIEHLDEIIRVVFDSLHYDDGHLDYEASRSILGQVYVIAKLLGTYDELIEYISEQSMFPLPRSMSSRFCDLDSTKSLFSAVTDQRVMNDDEMWNTERFYAIAFTAWINMIDLAKNNN